MSRAITKTDRQNREHHLRLVRWNKYIREYRHISSLHSKTLSQHQRTRFLIRKLHRIGNLIGNIFEEPTMHNWIGLMLIDTISNSINEDTTPFNEGNVPLLRSSPDQTQPSQTYGNSRVQAMERLSMFLSPLWRASYSTMRRESWSCMQKQEETRYQFYIISWLCHGMA